MTTMYIFSGSFCEEDSKGLQLEGVKNSNRIPSLSSWWDMIYRQNHLAMLLILSMMVVVIVLVIALVWAIHCLTIISDQSQVNIRRNMSNISRGGSREFIK